MKRTTILGFCFIALVAFAVWSPNVLATTNYSNTCDNCHTFTGTQHEFHRANNSLNMDCGECHGSSYKPVPSIQCANCHYNTSGKEGLLNQHIDNYGASCDNCHTPPSACNDSDGDGYGNPGDSSCPNGAAADCNDSDPSINPGAVEDCSDGKDNDCDGFIDSADSSAVNCPVNCTDSDEDGYDVDGACGPVDCDDTDASINPGAVEDCNDGSDNDCDGTIDSKDIDCYTCDQHTDRGQCKADPRCSWSGKNKECTEPVVSDAQSNCEADGGRWNKKKGTCR